MPFVGRLPLVGLLPGVCPVPLVGPAAGVVELVEFCDLKSQLGSLAGLGTP